MITNIEFINDSDTESSHSTAESQWQDGDLKDPYTNQRTAEIAEHMAADPDYEAKCYWQQRKAIRRYRFVKKRFGPKRRLRPRKIGRKVTRRGPSKSITSFQVKRNTFKKTSKKWKCSRNESPSFEMDFSHTKMRIFSRLSSW